MIEVEVFGEGPGAGGPDSAELARLCRLAGARRGVSDGHVAVELVDASRIAELNLQYRANEGPTDVLSFPIDGAGEPAGADGVPRELGDIVICPEHTADIGEAVVHGMLHLLGMDHEVDSGEMLALQSDLMGEAGR
jgi:probable rRNA maturation factor